MRRRDFITGMVASFAGAGNVRVVNRPQRRPPPRGRKRDYDVRPPAPTTELWGFPQPFLKVLIAATTVTGEPLWNYNTEVWREDYLERMSRFPHVEVPIYGFTVLDKPAGWVLVEKIKAYNAARGERRRTRVSWYTQIHYTQWDIFAAQRLSNRIYNLVTQGSVFRGLLISTAGQAYFDVNSPPNTDFLAGYAFPYGGSAGGPPKYEGTAPQLDRIKESFAAIWLEHAATQTVPADGWHCDHGGNLVANINHPEVPVVDLVAADYPNVAALNESSRNGVAYLCAQLKTRPEGKWIITNRGNGSPPYMSDADTLANFTGDLFEGWDPGRGIVGDNRWPQSNFSFAGAMTRLGVWRGPTPTSDGTGLVYTEFSPGGDVYGTAWNKLVRYGLGSATIMGCLHHTTSDNILQSPPHWMWVADEYSVTNEGVTDLNLDFVGWMGRPLEYGWQYDTDVWVRRFERGAVILNMKWDGSFSGGSVTVNLGPGYKRIQGIRSPSVNNGATASTFTVPFKDALFLHLA